MKLFKFLSMMIAAMACTFAFTSCGDDDDEPSGGLQTKMEYEVELSSTWMELCTVEVTYTDINGASQTEKMTSTTWSKNMQKNGDNYVPADIKVISTLKPDVKVDENSAYDLRYNINGKTGVYKSNGAPKTSKGFGSVEPIGSSTLKGVKVIEFIEKHSTIHYYSKETE